MRQSTNIASFMHETTKSLKTEGFPVLPGMRSISGLISGRFLILLRLAKWLVTHWFERYTTTLLAAAFRNAGW